MPKISIIIAVYNGEKYLNQCVDSILKQPYKDYEIILVEDGSTDHSLSVCNEYAQKNQLISVIHQENKGVSAARNTGMMAATGEYIMFIDSDDYILENCLYDISKIIEEIKVDLIIGKFETLLEDELKNEVEDCHLDAELINGKSNDDVLKYIMSINKYLYTVWRYVFKRDLVDKCGLYFIQGIFPEDDEWVPRLLCACQSFWLLGKPHYCYRIRKGSLSNTINVKLKIDAITIVEHLYSHSLKTEGVHKELMRLRAFKVLLRVLMLYEALDDIDKTIFYDYVSTKRGLMLSVIGYNDNFKNFLLILSPFFDIFSQP